LCVVLSDAWIVVVAVVAVVLNAVAETATLSRVIDGARPLRWFDRLGRLPGAEAVAAPSPAENDG
jgi:hypothetical protein